MLSGNFKPQVTQELEPKPSYLHTAYQSAQEPFREVWGAMGAVPGWQNEETRKANAEALDVINQSLADPRLPLAQRGVNMASGMIAMILPTAPLGGLGSILARPGVELAASGLAKLAPELSLSFGRKSIASLATGAMKEYLPEVTVSHFAKEATIGMAAYKAAVFPSHVMANYDVNNDVYNLSNAATETINDNWGFALPASIVAAGWLGNKVLKVRAARLEQKGVLERSESIDEIRKKASSPEEYDALVANKYRNEQDRLIEAADMAHDSGQISAHERDFIIDSVRDPHDPSLNGRAFELLKNQQLPIDRMTGRVHYSILEKDDIKNLNVAIADKLASSFSPEEAAILRDYMLGNRYDIVRANLQDSPAMLGGLHEYSAFVDKKLLGKKKNLAHFDEIIDERLSKGLKAKQVFSQKNIYRHLKKKKIFDIEHLPFHVPGNVEKRLKMRKAFEKFRKRYPGLDSSTMKAKVEAIPLLSAQEELAEIRSKLFKNGEVVSNYKQLKPYQRLLDLGEVNGNAKLLLKRIADEEVYKKHEAINGVVRRFTDFVDSAAERMAKPDKVRNYLAKRFERANPDLKPKEALVKPKEIKAPSLQDAKQQLADRNIEELHTKADAAASEYEAENRKREQFDESAGALQELMNCWESKLNG